MMTMNKFLSIAALALMGAMMTGCSSDDDNVMNNSQQLEDTNKKTVTLTTTVGLEGEAGTRALTIDGVNHKGVKTFAAGEQMAVVYNNGTSTVKAVSRALEAGDITDEGKTASFTFELETPNTSVDVTYIYPAAMAKDDGSINYEALASQDGTLATLASDLDLATKTAAWEGTSLPSCTLENQLAILAINLKYFGDITSDITGMIITTSDGGTGTPFSYTITGQDSDNKIYVAIRPTSGATINITATDGSTKYTKSLTGKTYEIGNGYNVSWRMEVAPAIDLSKLTTDYEAQYGDVLTGELGGKHKISIADGATVTLDGVTINGVNDGNKYPWAGITCLGDATIILKDGTTNNVKGFCEGYPGIFVPGDEYNPSNIKTLTIQGSGTLTASRNGNDAAGIGGGNSISCGNIVIQGGTITATGGVQAAGIGSGSGGSCGTITISGGDVTAIGGDSAAGIGCGFYSSCAGITISGGTVNATSDGCGAGIGSGYFESSCAGITISGGTVNATGGYMCAGIGSGYEYSSCAGITISGGTVTVKGGTYAAGIGSGGNGTCGDITIGSDVTQVIATKGDEADAPIGKGYNASCGTITIDGSTTWTAGTATTHYSWEVSNEGKTWTLTKQ